VCTVRGGQRAVGASTSNTHELSQQHGWTYLDLDSDDFMDADDDADDSSDL